MSESIKKSVHTLATNEQAFALSGDPSCSGHQQTSNWPNLSRFRKWVSRQVWAVEVIREFRSFLLRSRNLLFLRRVPFLDLGPELGVDQNSGQIIVCTHTLGRKKGIREFHAQHPEASLYQTILFLEGWNKGAEWASRNEDSCKPHSGHSCDTSKEWKGHF